MISIKFSEDTELLENRDKCLEYLRKHQVDVGLTSRASERSRFLLGIHTRGRPSCGFGHGGHMRLQISDSELCPAYFTAEEFSFLLLRQDFHTASALRT